MGIQRSAVVSLERVERLERRLEIYRRTHNEQLLKYEQNADTIRETNRQETLLLRQKFLESKVKRITNKREYHRSYKAAPSDRNKTPMASAYIFDPVLESKNHNYQPNMCQITPNGNYLMDKFPSISVKDDSGEDMLPPEVLHDLIKDITESPDYSNWKTDFINDEGCLLKYQESVGKENKLSKRNSYTFESDEVPLLSIQTIEQQLNGLLREFPGSNETSICTLSAPSILTPTPNSQRAQRQPHIHLF